MKKTTKLFALLLSGLAAASVSYAKPAPTHYVDVTVVNTCSKPITFQIDNNWGSMLSGSHGVGAYGSKTPDGKAANIAGFIFSSSNDEEYYTISYQGASCVVNYAMITNRWSMDVAISKCDTTPTCKIY